MSSKVIHPKSFNSTARKMPLYRHPWFYVALVLVVALIVFGVWFAFFRSTGETQEVLDTTNNSIGAVPSSTNAKGEDAEKDDENAATGKKQTPIQYDGENPNTLDEITGYISYSAINYDHLSIRLTINQYLTSGTCDLTMTSGSNKYTISAPIEAGASTATCQGFDVPLSELPSGDWQISIKIVSDGKTGTITGEASV